MLLVFNTVLSMYEINDIYIALSQGIALHCLLVLFQICQLLDFNYFNKYNRQGMSLKIL